MVRRGALGLLSLLSLTAPAAAQPFWTSTGPPGGVVQSLAASPSDARVVYAGIKEGGVFRTDDGGDVWRAVTAGLGHFDVLSLAISPTDSLRVLAGTLEGAFGSADGGATWAVAAGLAGVRVDAILFDPVSPQTVYAAGSGGTLAKSLDGGSTWSPIGGTVATLAPLVLAIHPTQTATVYLGTVNDGVYRSDNAGASWSARNSGLDNLHVSALAIDPLAPETVYAGTENGGLFRSQDGGSSWSAFNPGLSGSQVRALAADSSGAIYLGNQNGVYLLAPGAAGFVLLALNQNWVNTLAVGPGASRRLFVGYGNLPFVQGGVSWSDDRIQFTRAREGLNALLVAALAADSFAPSRALAAIIGGSWETNDGGATWSFFSLPTPFPVSIVFDTAISGVAYAGGSQGVWKSIDGGATWAAAASGLPNAIIRWLLPLPGSGGAVVAGTSQGVYRSADGAASWAATAGLSGVPIYGLAVDASSPSTLWAGTEGAVFRSLDSGASWSQTGTVPGIVRALYASPGIPERVFAGTDTGLFVSSNGGSTWTAVSNFPATSVYALLPDDSGSTLYAGTDQGVLENVAGHTPWTATAPGLTNPKVRALALLPDGNLLAGTQAGSVFRLVRQVEPAPRGPVSRAADRGQQPRTVIRP